MLGRHGNVRAVDTLFKVRPKSFDRIGMVNTDGPLFNFMVHGHMLKTLFAERPVAAKAIRIHC